MILHIGYSQMGKVVTSQGLTDFVQTGKVTHVPDHKPADAKAPEVKPEEAKKPPETEKKPDAAESAPKQPEVTSETDTDEAEDDTGLRASDHEFSEKTRKRIQAKHRALKDARLEAQENERFAEQQFNERKLAEKRAQEAEERAKALEAQLPKAPPVPELVEPVETDDKYKDEAGNFKWKDFARDLAKFEAAKAVKDEKDKQQQERAAAERTEAETRMRQRFDAVRKAHPDFDDMVEKIKGTEADRVPQHVLNYLFESEKGGELHYYLLKNPVESVRISKLKPILALAELGKLEAKLAEPPAKTAPSAPAEPVNRKEPGGAPAPITPLSGEGTTGIVTDPAKMDFKQLRAYRREQERARRER